VTSPIPLLTRTTPSGRTTRGPKRSMSMPRNGAMQVAATKPTEKAPAVTPRSHPNSVTRAGNRRENAVRVLTAIPMVTKATATITQP
jgi:hypothetical protein